MIQVWTSLDMTGQVWTSLNKSEQVWTSLDKSLYMNSILYLLNKFTFLCNKSSANCNPTAFMSVFCKADVIYMCMSKKRSIAPPCSACSISNCESKLTNHSKDLWSRLIQKKSTWKNDHNCIAEPQLRWQFENWSPSFLELFKNEGLLALFYTIKNHLTSSRGYKNCFLAWLYKYQS